MPPFLSLRPPTRAEVRSACAHGASKGHNYPAALVGTSDRGSRRSPARAEGDDDDDAAERSLRGWAIDETRTKIGTGEETYARCVAALEKWEHFNLGWARVDGETTGTRVGEEVCVEARVGPVWIRNPLRVVRLEGRRRRGDDDAKKRFTFAHGTLGGHLLAGEERFAVELGRNGDVYYEAYAFSKPAHALSVLGYPVVRLLQKRFHWDSARAMKRIASGG